MTGRLRTLFYSFLIFSPVFVFAQNYHIDATGGDCSQFGTWDSATQTCSLTTDVPGVISFDTVEHITLLGNGKKSQGLDFHYSKHITVKDLLVNQDGIRLLSAPYTTLINNTVSDTAQRGLYVLGYSDHLTMSGNVFVRNPTHMVYWPDTTTAYPGNTIDQTNTFDGKTLYYFEGVQDQTINLTNPARVFCIRCTNVTLRGGDFAVPSAGGYIGIYFSEGVTVDSNNFSKLIDAASIFAIQAIYATSTTIVRNVIEGDPNTLRGYSGGAQLIYAPRSVVRENVFRTNANGGVYVGEGSENTLIEDNDFYNDGGISIYSPTQIVHNNFYDSRKRDILSLKPAYATTSLPLPVGGNYYSSYDEESEGCVDTDTNGVCDTPFVPTQRLITRDDLPWKSPSLWKNPPVAEKGFSSVLFLPGLQASRLYKQGLFTENQLWEPNRNADVEALYLNPDGTSKNADIYTRDIVLETNVPSLSGVLGLNIYKSFGSTMDGLVRDRQITEWKAYPYDWRMDVETLLNQGVITNQATSSVFLVDTLRQMATRSKTGKVTIITHSNGGLLAKALFVKLAEMKKNGDDLLDKVDMVVFVAVPHIGTPKAIASLLHGYDQKILFGTIVRDFIARDFGRYMTSGYTLLPSQKYSENISTPFVSFGTSTASTTALDIYTSYYGKNINSYDSLQNFLLGREGRQQAGFLYTENPLILEEKQLLKAQQIHQKLDNWTPPITLRVISIAGWGLNTLSGIQYGTKKICAKDFVGGCQFVYTLDPKPIITNDGDETVVSQSALWVPGEKWWINMNEYNKNSIDKKHSTILEVNQLLSFIESYLKKEVYVEDEILTKSKPTTKSKSIVISVHSPVSIEATDELGRVTRKTCPENSDFCYADESIPNSSYFEFGDDKYIALSSDYKHVTLQGIGTGTFTYTEEVTDLNGKKTEYNFTNLPVTKETIATITQPVGTTTPRMTLDVNGDGKTDLVISPENTFNPVTHLKVLREMVKNFNTRLLVKQLLILKIDHTIKLIERGKIDRAKLRAELFKNVLEKSLIRKEKKGTRPGRLSVADTQLIITMIEELLTNLNK